MASTLTINVVTTGGSAALSVFQGMTGALAAMGIASKAMDLVSAGLDAVGQSAIGTNARLEQARISFTTMLGSAQQAQGFLNEMRDFAARTPFAFPDLLEASKRMMGMGIAAAEVKPLLEAVGNTAAAMGAGQEGIDRITRALGQMSAKGKVSAEEINQLAEVGVPGWQLLADAMGITTAEAMKAAEQGKITSDVFIKAFKDFSAAKYGDQMAQQGETFTGAVDRIKDSLDMLVADGTAPLFKELTNLAVMAADFLGSNEFQQWAADTADAISKMVGFISTDVKAMFASLPAIINFEAIGKHVAGFVTGLIFHFRAAGAVIGTFGEALSALSRGELVEAKDAIGRMDDALVKAVQDARRDTRAFADLGGGASVAFNQAAADINKVGQEMDKAALKLPGLQAKIREFGAEEAKVNADRATKFRELTNDLEQSYADATLRMKRRQEDWALEEAQIRKTATEKINALQEQEAEKNKSKVDRIAEINRIFQAGQESSRLVALQAEREKLEQEVKASEGATEKKVAKVREEEREKLAALDREKQRAIEDHNLAVTRQYDKTKYAIDTENAEAEHKITRIEEKKTAAINALDTEIRKLQELQGEYDKLSAKINAVPTYAGGAPGGRPEARAHGGPVSAFQSYIVGEMGPELFTPGQSGNITANAELRQRAHAWGWMLGAGGAGNVGVGQSGSNVNITVQVSGVVSTSVNQLANELAPALRETLAYERARGGTSYNVTAGRR